MRIQPRTESLCQRESAPRQRGRKFTEIDAPPQRRTVSQLSFKVRLSAMWMAYWLSGCLFTSGVVYAWQDATSVQLEKPEAKAGLNEITLGRVTSTISFLASDELAGRATGSAEFNIAAAYVAARFRGAGLEGGAAEGSFYHETIVKQTLLPSDGIQLHDEQGQPSNHWGLLSAADQPFSYQGGVTTIDLSQEIPSSGLQGVIVAKPTANARGPRLLSQITRTANSLQTAGATAWLVAVNADSELLELAQDLRRKPRTDSGNNRASIPVLLIPEDRLKMTSCRLQVPATINSDAVMRNVIGVLRGSDPQLSEQAVLYSAHLDHLGNKPDPVDGIFNGADDDASGVTAVVTLADAFAAIPRPKRSLIFMTFWGEESGLLGSKQFVETPSWPLEKIIANINIEMIGRPEPGAGGKIWMTGWQKSDLGSLMNQASKPFGVEIFEHPTFSARLYGSSDNWSFAKAGVVAHSFSAGSLHADYHQPNDEWERLELNHMTRVIQGLFMGSLPLASGDVKPTQASPN